MTAKQPATQPHPSPVCELAVELIDGPQFNPREDFEEAGLRSLAESIADVGLLEPIIVRPAGERYELVAGERRLRAVKFLGWELITATVRELNDKAAGEIRLLENLDRESLNGIEEARAFRQLRELGHSPESLAELTRMTEADVATRLRILDLPADWQERIRDGKLSIAAAEYLLDWTGYPQVLERMAAHADRYWPQPLTAWGAALWETVYAFSRSMNPDAPDGPQFEIRPEDWDALEVVTVRKSPAIKAHRAMNVTLWDRRQDQANAVKPAARIRAAGNGAHAAASTNGNGKSAGATSGKAGGSGAPPRRRKSDSSFVSDDTGESDFPKRLARFKAEWYREKIEDQLTHVVKTDPAHVVSIGEELGIDPAREWILTREFLELHSGRQLAALAEELGVDSSWARSRDELIAVLLSSAPPTPPQAFLEALREPVAGGVEV